MKIYFTLTTLLLCLYGSAQAQIISRLVAESSFDHDATGYIPADSSTYTYSYSRGSNMETGLYSFDTSIYYANDGNGLGEELRYLRTYESPTGERVISEVTQTYTNGNWENIQRKTYHYPTAFGAANFEKKDTILIEQWNIHSKSFHMLQRFSYTYNANKDVTQELEEQYNEISNLWSNRTRKTYTFSGTNLQRSLTEQWDIQTNSWTNEFQRLYVYSSGKLAKDSLQVWDAPNSKWVNNIKIVYGYNVSGNNSMLAQYRWDDNTMSWVEERMNEYEYTNNRLTSDTLSSWDKTTSMWVKNWLYTYNFDNAGNLLMSQTHAPGPDTFQRYRMEEWTYNTYNQPTKMQAYVWDFTTSSWIVRDGTNIQENYYYELFNTGIHQLYAAQPELTLFPVPASSFVMMRIPVAHAGGISIRIYDAGGRMVRQFTDQAAGTYSRSIPVSDLQAGMYFLKVTTDNKEMTKTLLIQH